MAAIELAHIFRRLKPLDAILRFFIPILEQIGFEVSAGRLSIAQEHILSAMLKQNVHRLIQTSNQKSKIKIVIASPEGDFHELGILGAHAIANQLKVCSIFIGPNTPKDQLCETASRFGATHVILGSTVSKNEGAKEDFYSVVHFLDKNLPIYNTSCWHSKSRGGKMIKLASLILFLLTLNVEAIARIDEVTGTAKADGQVAYIEKHKVEYTGDGKLLRAETSYETPAGIPVALLKSDFTTSVTAPDHTVEDFRTQASREIRQKNKMSGN